MAKIISQPRLDIKAVIEFNEEELRALDALTGYGFKPFIEEFYAHMGSAYMKPHEEGCRSFFESVRKIVPGILSQIDKARESLKVTPEFVGVDRITNKNRLVDRDTTDEECQQAQR